MIAAAESVLPGGASVILTSAMIFGGAATACYLGYQPLKELILGSTPTRSTHGRRSDHRLQYRIRL